MLVFFYSLSLSLSLSFSFSLSQTRFRPLLFVSVTSIYILLCVCGAAASRFAGIIGNEVDFAIAHKVINECENLQSVKVCPKCPSVNPGYFFAAVATELS
jgi:hypothetical protein